MGKLFSRSCHHHLSTSLLAPPPPKTRSFLHFPEIAIFFLHKLMFLSGSGQVGREREGERESLFDDWAGCMCGSACFERGENIKIWRIPFFSELVHVA
jgi:hypothetical protein